MQSSMVKVVAMGFFGKDYQLPLYLQIPSLVHEVGWLKGAVRFIECCVAVDPFARHSAEALLQHDFLY